MARTAMRPIPRGKVSKVEALAFGLAPGVPQSRLLPWREPGGGRAVGLHDSLLCCRIHGSNWSRRTRHRCLTQPSLEHIAADSLQRVKHTWWDHHFADGPSRAAKLRLYEESPVRVR